MHFLAAKFLPRLDPPAGSHDKWHGPWGAGQRSQITGNYNRGWRGFGSVFQPPLRKRREVS